MECYVKFLDSKNKFRETKKDFKTYEDAWEWILENLKNRAKTSLIITKKPTPMDKVFIECKKYGNTLVSMSNDNQQFYLILYNSFFYEFELEKNEVTATKQAKTPPNYLNEMISGKHNLVKQLN